MTLANELRDKAARARERLQAAADQKALDELNDRHAREVQRKLASERATQERLESVISVCHYEADKGHDFYWYQDIRRHPQDLDINVDFIVFGLSLQGLHAEKEARMVQRTEYREYGADGDYDCEHYDQLSDGLLITW